MKHPRSKAVARAAKFALAAGAVMAAAACAAVLGIDDRELIGPTTGSEAGDAPNGETSADGPVTIVDGGDGSSAEGSLADAAGKVCDPAGCGDAGGACASGSCAFACGAGCKNQVIACPPGNDRQRAG